MIELVHTDIIVRINNVYLRDDSNITNAPLLPSERFKMPYIRANSKCGLVPSGETNKKKSRKAFRCNVI